MAQATQFVVLNTTKLGDKSIVVHALSRDLGRRSFIASAGRGAALFQPMNILDAEVLENRKSELWRIRGVAPAYPLGGIRGNIHKNSITLFLGELLFRSIKEGAYEEGLYDWCVSRILTLDSMPGNFANFHLLFLLELASALGFSPSVEDILPFAEENASKIPLLLQAPVEEFMLVPLSGRERSEIADSLLRYLSYHLEYPLNIKSLRVLSELYR